METEQINLRLNKEVIRFYQDKAKKDDRTKNYYIKKIINDGAKINNKVACSNQVDIEELTGGHGLVGDLIDYLNLRAGTKFQKKSSGSKRLIEARLKQFSVDDCKTVIDKKCREWPYRS